MYYRSQEQRFMSKIEDMTTKMKSLQSKCDVWEEKYEEIVLLREQEKMDSASKLRQSPHMTAQVC